MWESYFGINRTTRSLATPARCSRGRIQERVQGDTAYRRRFPLHPLCKLRRGQPPFEPPLVERRAAPPQPPFREPRCPWASSTPRRRALPAAKADPVVAPCSGCVCPASPVLPCHRDHDDPQRLDDDAPAGDGAAIAHVPSTMRIPAKPLLAEAFHSSFSPRTTWRLDLVHLCTLPTCRKGRGKPSASRKLKPSGFPLSPLRPFGAGASSTA